MDKHLTARCRIIRSGKEQIYQFFCDLSGALVCAAKTKADCGDALERLWETEARARFNRCRKCGKWVCDTMYNPDTLQCVECSPWEDTPAFCSQCGKKVESEEVFCADCQARLRYGGEDHDDKAPG